jgi:hypothetical protein
MVWCKIHSDEPLGKEMKICGDMGIVFLYKKGYEIVVTFPFITFYPISILHSSNLINYITK